MDFVVKPVVQLLTCGNSELFVHPC